MAERENEREREKEREKEKEKEKEKEREMEMEREMERLYNDNPMTLGSITPPLGKIQLVFAGPIVKQIAIPALQDAVRIPITPTIVGEARPFLNIC